MDINNVICHAPYIVNPASNDLIKQDFAVSFLTEEIRRCSLMGVTKIVLHPGSAVNETREEGLNNIVKALNAVLDNDYDVKILLETMAGKGNECGINLEEINYQVPKELKANLRDYQLTGFKWFKTLSHYEFGGILADEMGLGKTIQTIAFLLSEKNKKSIIVTPTSLIYNWRSEFEKFAPTMKIKVVHGNKEDREFTKEEIKDIDVLLTTYGTLRNDYNLYDDINFDFCIVICA